jgi:hypothetical protein
MQSSSDSSTSKVARLRRFLDWHWLTPVALILFGLIIQRLARGRPELVERIYGRVVYPPISRAISLISRPFPFSLAEVLIFILPLVGLVLILIRTRAQLLQGQRGPQILRARTCEFIWLLAILFLTFQICFGLNYQRPPLSSALQFSPRQATSSELETIATHIIGEINRNFEQSRPPADRPGGPRNRAQIFDAIESGFQSASLLGGAARGGFGSPKPVFISRALTKLGIAGVYSPFTGEPNFNTEQPENELPFSAAHEKAHQRGYAREDEASFVAFLVCTASSDSFVRYSGYLRGLRVLAPLRASVTPERYREIVDQLLPGVRADLQETAAFWQRGSQQTAERCRRTRK